jgi:hypothetical protein
VAKTGSRHWPIHCSNLYRRLLLLLPLPSFSKSLPCLSLCFFSFFWIIGISWIFAVLSLDSARAACSFAFNPRAPYMLLGSCYSWFSVAMIYLRFQYNYSSYAHSLHLEISSVPKVVAAKPYFSNQQG